MSPASLLNAITDMHPGHLSELLFIKMIGADSIKLLSGPSLTANYSNEACTLIKNNRALVWNTKGGLFSGTPAALPQNQRWLEGIGTVYIFFFLWTGNSYPAVPEASEIL